MATTALDRETGLLERAQALDALDAALATASRTAGRLVLVAGEAGVGKTVLVRRFCTRHGNTARTLLADGYLGAAIELASDPDRDLWWMHLLGYRARLELDVGRWMDATETAGVILRNRRVSPLPVVLALSVLGRLRARRGDPDPWGPLDEALALA